MTSFTTVLPRVSLPARKRVQAFNLVRWFLLLSFTSIAITSAASAYVLSRFLKENMLERDAVVTMELVNSIVRAQQAQSHFIASDPSQGNDALERLFTQIASLPEVIRANLYGSTRAILWSSDPAFIGAVFPTNPELDKALRGEIETEEGLIGENRKAEHAFLEGEGAPFVENYLPIWGDDGGVIGVVEVYKSPDALYAAIDRGTTLIWTNAAVGGLVLYLALIWIVHRANIVMTEQRRQIAESQALAAVGEMASAVAHGLRNPLASIRSSAELSLEEEAPKTVKDALRDVVSQADRLESWVRELLISSRPDSFDFEPLQVNGLVAEVTGDYESRMAKRKVRLELRLAPDLPVVEANAMALRQVLHSLIANALEAMPEGGPLAVSTGLAKGGGRVAISITDSGQGIPRSERGRVFQPFVTTKGRGLGVGLPLARRIIERHRGRLELSPAANGGTVAEIEMPAAG